MNEDLKTLSDRELVTAADQAWQRGDSARAEAIKAERALRRGKEANVDRADTAIYRAGIAAALISAFSFLGVFFGFIDQRGLSLEDMMMPVAYTVLTFGVFKGSRTAIVAMTLLCLANVALSIYHGHNGGGIFTIIICYYLLRGVKGAFAGRALERKAAEAQGDKPDAG